MNKNEYIVQPNEKGGYDLILGGVGLGAHEAIDLMNELKTKGIVPVTAEITLYINGNLNMPQINENAQKFTDKRLEQNYNMSVNPGDKPEPEPEPGDKPEPEPGDKPEPELNTIAGILTSETLQQNYNMSVDSSAELGLKPSEEEHHKTR